MLYKQILLAVTAVVASSALFFWGTGLHPAWWLTWLAPLPVLLASQKLGRWSTFFIAALSWISGTTNMWYYFLRAIEMPIPVVVFLSLIPACLFAFGVLLFRGFVLRGALWRAALVFPMFWVTLEYLNNLTSAHGTFPNLGYTQMDFIPILQITSLVGIWGISFCLFLFPAAAALVANRAASVRDRAKVASAVALFLAAVIGYGSWRLMSSPAQHSLKVGLMASGVNSRYPHSDPAALALFREYSDKAKDLARQGAEIVVLPEKIAVISDRSTSVLDSLYSDASAQSGAEIVVGLDRGSMTSRSNEARLYFPDGRLIAIYDKHHLVPRIEDVDQPGSKITVLDQPSGVWGIQICKDMDFPALSRQYGQRGVGLLLVPAWDFTLDAWLHGRMAVMRGVENGFTIVRSAKQGLLTVSDNRGHILAQQDAATVPFATLLATAPVHHDNTLYSRWGDWFAWLNIAGLIAILLSRRQASAVKEAR